MNEEIEVIKGRLAAMQACMWVMSATLPRLQARKAATLLRAQSEAVTASALASPLSDVAREWFERETAGIVALLEKTRD